MTDLNNKNSCIILTRVSTNQQDYTAQIDDLSKWANNLGYTNIKVISTKESGFKTFDLKDGFKQVIDFINENNAYKTIIVTELSRLSRKRIVLEQIKHYLTENKIQLLIKDISFSLFDTNGFINFATDITFSLFATMAENEMITKKIRGRRELNSLQSKGISITGKRLFGYNRVHDESIKKNRFVINENEANEIRTIYNWYLYGIDGDKSKCNMKDINIACIAKGFSPYLHSKRNVTKALGEKAYTGHKITNNWRKNTEYWSYGDKTKERYVKCSSDLLYPQILSDELFNLVQEKKLKNNTTADKSSKHITLLSKLIKCPACGLYLGGNYRYRGGYVAHNYRCTRRQMAVNCTFKGSYSMPLLDSTIWCYIKSDIENLVAKMQNYYNSINLNTINKEIDNLKLKISDLENDKEHEADIFRIMSKNNREKALEEFSTKITSLDKQIEIFKNKINDKIKTIEGIEYNKKLNANNNIKEEIDTIENDKTQLKKYINLFVKEINVLYNDISYMVLKLGVIDKIDTFDFDSVKFNENDLTYSTYLVVDKHDNNRIKVRCIDNPKCIFKDNHFELNGYPTLLNQIFDIPCLDYSNEPYLSMNNELKKELKQRIIHFDMKEIFYKRLNVY
jgi:DNA invertase Pin-like site-specific DNA recombinase